MTVTLLLRRRGNFLLYSLRNFQVHNRVLLTAVPLLHATPQDLFILISFYSLLLSVSG